MSRENERILPSHIAAAQLKDAIAQRTGSKVPQWVRNLAGLPLYAGVAPEIPGRVQARSPKRGIPRR